MLEVDTFKAEDEFRQALRERFFAKTRISDSPHEAIGTPCIIWTGPLNRDGYGNFWIPGKKMQKAHRVAWWLKHGKWPNPCALHRCDNPSCVREDHLFEGTVADNNSDKVAKGRAVFPPKGDLHWSRVHPERRLFGDRNGMRRHPGIKKGVLNGHVILNEKDVREIRELRASGFKQKDLAERFGVSRQAIGYVCSANGWSHVD